MKQLSALIFLSLTVLSVTADEGLNITVLYESLCPDSVRFITTQLYPAWRRIEPHVNLQFVPFGKSRYIGDGVFECQHGPLECHGNKIQSCVLSILDDQTAQVEFVNCFMKAFLIDNSGKQCTDSFAIDWPVVQNCYNSDLGTQLQLREETITNTVKPKFVPTIVYNNIFHQVKQDSSLKDFVAVVCAQLSPDACKEPVSRVWVEDEYEDA